MCGTPYSVRLISAVNPPADAARTGGATPVTSPSASPRAINRIDLRIGSPFSIRSGRTARTAQALPNEG
jgi:hypothetical protein